MPDSVLLPGKRERLVTGAQELLHRQGVEKTTLAQIAEAADVPVGNVYYYFKTKDELVEAAIEEHAAGIREALAALERRRTPRARLKAMIRGWADDAGMAAERGCPHGGLCHELDKRDDELGAKAATLLALTLDWVEEQFKLMGRRDARDLAVALVSTFQGASLLANTFRDPSLMTREARRLDAWIESL